MTNTNNQINPIYHIYNRGVDKREIFLDNKDYFRFIHDLYEFNDENPARNSYSRSTNEVGLHELLKNPIVKIHAFCLMPNHYHLLMEEGAEKGFSAFMQKLGVGYTHYFNQRHERTGVLFQGKPKFKLVASQKYFIHIPHYIHLNPLNLIEPEWKHGNIKDFKKMINFLESYGWSSYLDYIGKRNFPSVIYKNFLAEFFETPQKYKKETIDWLKDATPEKINLLLC